MTAWLSLPMREPAAGLGQPPRRPDAVGEVALGRRGDADVGAGAAEQRDVVVGQVGGVHDRRARSEQPLVVEQPGRRDAVRRQAGLVLGDLLGEVDVQRRPAAEHVQLVARHGPHRVDRGRAVADALGPPLRGPVAVAQLDALGRGAEAAADVAGVEQRDPDAGLGGGRPQRVAHRRGLGVVE